MRDYTTLDKIATIYNGNSINADYKKKHFFGLETGFPFIATKDVSFNGEVNYDNGVRIPFNTEYKIAEAGSVFICAEGGSAGRKIAYITEKVCFGNKLFCIQPKDEKYLGRFLYYYLMSDTFQSQFKLMLTGLIGGVSAKKFKAFTVPVATFAEQERIVALLDDQFAKIDQLKANADLQLQTAKDLFQSALKQLLTPKEGWEMKRVGDIFNSYSGGTPLKSHQEYYTNARIPWLNSGEVCRKYITETDNYISEEGLKNSSAKYFPINTVLVAMYGATAAQAGILKFEATSNQAICGLLPNDNMMPEFVYYWFVYNKEIFASMAQGGAQPNLSQIKIKAMPMPYIEKDKQKIICEKLTNIEEKVKALQANYDQTINLCNDLKQALLKSIFA